MIEYTQVDGRPATVAYLTMGADGSFQPATKESHTMVKVMFDDGDLLFATREEPDDEPSEEPPSKPLNAAQTAIKMRQRISELKDTILKYNEAHQPGGQPIGGQFAPAERYGLVAGDAAKFRALKAQWASVNNSLLRYVDKPDSSVAQAKMKELEAISQKIHVLHADPGTSEGIGLPGGPRDVTIVGAGPGGLSAGIMGGAEGLDTLVVESNAVAGGQAKFSSRIENFPGFPVGVTGEHLTHDMFEQAQRLGTEAKLGTRVTGMTYDPATGIKQLTLSDGTKIDSRTVILAGGVEFRRMDFPGSNGPGVIVGDGKMLAQETKGGKALVIGGSNGAAQAALGASLKNEHVYLMSRSPIKTSMSDYQVEALKNNPKITVLEGDSIAKLNRGADGNPESVETTGGKKLDVKAVGLFIGSMPDTKWVPETVQRDKGGRVQTSPDLETGIPGVYAVGDMRQGAIGRIGVAVGEGQLALRQANVYLEGLKKKSGAPVSKALGDTTSELITRLFALDRDNPYFGQTIDGVDPARPAEAIKKRIAELKEMIEKYDPNEPRDVRGRWSTGGGEGVAGTRKVEDWKKQANEKFKSIDDLLAVSTHQQAELQAVGHAIAKTIPDVEFKPAWAKTHDEEGNIYQKGLDRISEKAVSRGFGGVTDVARMGFIVNTPSEGKHIVAELKKHFPTVEEGYQRGDWGYYDNKALVKLSSGLVAEVQIVEKHIDHAKYEEGGNGLYADPNFAHQELMQGARSLPGYDPRRIDNQKKSVALYDAAVQRSDQEWQKVYERAKYRKE